MDFRRMYLYFITFKIIIMPNSAEILAGLQSTKDHFALIAGALTLGGAYFNFFSKREA